ncbi:hypothetical protein [Anaerocolumna sp. MB42-C2]|uniref:hypothetical protein n=1 Tax=Anaerocolumna sp. MB42-C2 TaxID=3070997 RepID=UPI0027E06CFC|nr:hypothetical protein [Anaerocolumna sp. MB42-C2]WMJ86212.1 hypothetical protein RBU59_19510 [Anaerocolumna sp. MB42-C2]
MKINKYIENFASRGDERTIVTVGKAASITLYLTYIYLIIIMLYKIVLTKSFESAYSDVVLLILITVTYLISLKSNKDYSPEIPVSIRGKSLNLEVSKEGKKKRLIQYFKDSVVLSISISILNCLFSFYIDGKSFYKNTGFVKEIISLFIMLLAFSYLYEIIIKEKKVREYDKFLKTMEDVGEDT